MFPTPIVNFGKISAKLDDIANYIPSRITAVLISILFWNLDAFKRFYSFGKLHDSPNAGHPISALALSLGVKLGGNTSYFGKIKEKPHFGDGKKEINTHEIEKALVFRDRFELSLLVILILYIISLSSFFLFLSLFLLFFCYALFCYLYSYKQDKAHK